MTSSRTELYLRMSHQSMVALLVLILFLGGATFAMALQPDGTVSRFFERGAWAIPVLLALVVGVLQRKGGWDPKSAEARAVLGDEWRQRNLARATRAAFLVTLIVQVPLALIVPRFAPAQPLLAMAVATITIGALTHIALFLVFDRDGSDER